MHPARIPFRLIRLIDSSGAQGEVFLAERTDGVTPREIAVKKAHLDLNAEAAREQIQLLDRDLMSILHLNHPHLVRHLDHHNAAETTTVTVPAYHIVMEYCAVTTRVSPSLKSDQLQYEFRQGMSDAGLRFSGRAAQILKSHREMLVRKENQDRYTRNINGAGLERFIDPSYTGRGSIDTTMDMYLTHRMDSRDGHGYTTSAESSTSHPCLSSASPSRSVAQSPQTGDSSAVKRSPKAPLRKRRDDDYRYVGYGYSAT